MLDMIMDIMELDLIKSELAVLPTELQSIVTKIIYNSFDEMDEVSLDEFSINLFAIFPSIFSNMISTELVKIIPLSSKNDTIKIGISSNQIKEVEEKYHSGFQYSSLSNGTNLPDNLTDSMLLTVLKSASLTCSFSIDMYIYDKFIEHSSCDLTYTPRDCITNKILEASEIIKQKTGCFGNRVIVSVSTFVELLAEEGFHNDQSDNHSKGFISSPNGKIQIYLNLFAVNCHDICVTHKSDTNIGLIYCPFNIEIFKDVIEPNVIYTANLCDSVITSDGVFQTEDYTQLIKYIDA